MTPTLTDFTERGSGGTVVATCSSCGDRHPVSDRERDDTTTASTVCPVCGSPAYSSEVVDE